MTNYLLLLRGVNVGGKNKIPMAALRASLEKEGFANVSTYIQSGNVLLKSILAAEAVGDTVEKLLIKNFALDSGLIKVLVLTKKQLETIIINRPKGFGEQPDIYHSDVIFLMGIDVHEALAVFSPRDEVDRVWPGHGVIYSQRLSAERTKSRLNRIMLSPLYKSMTIRNWNTTTKLLTLL